MKIIIFYHFDSDPRFPPFLLYVRWKSGVTFVRRCFRDDFTAVKMVNFRKNCDIFLIFAQNIDLGYTFYRVPTMYVLEQKYQNNVYPCKPHFRYLKVGCKGVYITRTC